MAQVIDFERLTRQGATVTRFDLLDESDRAHVAGFATGLLAQYGFDAIYNALTPTDRQTIDSYITDLLHQRQRPHHTTT